MISGLALTGDGDPRYRGYASMETHPDTRQESPMKFRMISMTAAFVVAAAFAGGAEAQTNRMHLGPRVS
jgi:hypothetical protein